MRPGLLRNRIKFYTKTSVRDAFNASVDSWDTVAISTRGNIRHVGGARTSSSESVFFSKSRELTIRHRVGVEETMRVQIDGEDARYSIDYIEIVGNEEWLRLSLDKIR